MPTQDLQEALSIAGSAAERCRRLTPSERGRLLCEAARRLMERKDDFKEAICREQGKTDTEAEAEIELATEAIRFFAAEAERAYGRILPDSAPDTASRLILQPAGLCAAITGWEMPLLSAAEQAAAAFAAGCAIILLPARETPTPAKLLSRAFREAGAPEGAVWALPGGEENAFARSLAGDSRIRYLFCEADEETGRSIAAERAGCVGRAGYRLGDTAPMIVCEDADARIAARAAAESAFSNAGQCAWSVKRAYIAAPLFEEFTQTLCSLANLRKPVRLCRGSDAEALRAKLREALARGYTMLAGGEREEGRFAPMVLSGAGDCALASRSAPGPFVLVEPFCSVSEAIDRANRGSRGLYAFLFTNDLMLSHMACSALDVGAIAVNQPIPRLAGVPHSARRSGGYGAVLGQDGMCAYMETKHIRMRYLGKERMLHDR